MLSRLSFAALKASLCPGMHRFPGTGESSLSGEMCPSPNTPSLTVMVEFAGSACEGKNHPFISLWTNGAIMERAALTVSSLHTRKRSLVSPSLQVTEMPLPELLPGHSQGLCLAVGSS